ncbi:MAG: hypothetical protein ACJAVI_004664 [Candidatus Azotimanducaceae bacterium]|jgi:hypothetical protein
MRNILDLIKKNQIIFGLVVVAFLLDITGSMRSVMPGAIFGLPSALAIIFFLGAALFVRFLITRRPVHLAITWPLMIVLYFGWFVLMAALSDGASYRPSILVWLCLFAAFKTLRFQPEPVIEKNAAEESNEKNS